MKNEKIDIASPQKLFRKKPVVIEAERFGEGFGELSPEFDVIVCAGFGNCPSSVDGLHIHTLEGAMKLSDGDWIIKGIKGEFYPIKDDIFAATYEPAASRELANEESRHLLLDLESCIIAAALTEDDHEEAGHQIKIDEIRADILRRLTPEGPRPVVSEAVLDEIVLAVCELPDRTSPDDWPEAMIVTPEELKFIIRDKFEQFALSGESAAAA